MDAISAKFGVCLSLFLVFFSSGWNMDILVNLDDTEHPVIKKGLKSVSFLDI